jgi:predicted phage replisome organizer
VADIKWIKIYTDMVNNKKIKSIRKMPEGNNIVLIWVLLIAQAGESNKTGALYLTDTIPFTVDELAIQLDFEKQILNLALLVLEKYEMIEVFDDIIFIKNWAKYQNESGMEKIREQGRIRVARCRENKKVLEISSQCNATVTLPVTQGNAIEQEQEQRIKNKELNKRNNSGLEINFVPEEIKETVIEFISYRKQKKSPLTEHSLKLMINKLKNLSADYEIQKQILNESMINGWTGIFQLKDYQPAKPREKTLEEITADLTARQNTRNSEVPEYKPMYGVDLRE